MGEEEATSELRPQSPMQLYKWCVRAHRTPQEQSLANVYGNEEVGHLVRL